MMKNKRYRGNPFISAKDIALLLSIGIAFVGAHSIVAWMDKPVEPEIAVVTVKEPPVVEEVPVEVVEEPVLVSLGEFKTTAFCPCIKCCGVWSSEHPSRGADYVQKTASGTIPEEGRTIAADWSVLPEGTEVIINGHTYTVEDTGSGVNDKHIDVFFADHQEALEWGVQKHEVFVRAVEA